MPKPTLSKLIQGLEAHLRTKLLNRTTRRVTVTADGAAYYERVVRILADVDELDGSMTLSQASPKGRLRIDISASLAMLIMIPALPQFHARYPDIQIDLGVTDRPVDLVGENVDCVVRGGRDHRPVADRAAHRRIRLRLLRVAVLSGAARRAAPSGRARARSHRRRLFPCELGKPVSAHVHPRRRAAGGRRAATSSRSMTATPMWRRGLAGLGIMAAPHFMVEQHLASGALRPVLPDWSTAPVPLYVVYPPNRHLSTKLRIFVDWVAELFAAHLRRA